ncbi:uncharacterized protein A4U43_C07F34270 [Asparagus officinalis]|uniref:Uncharacterized protein n=1 Tax=Asparagus officinalis TaxID=4686 RepID=A0A5P1EGY0_ASPOF|nr:uncharacterized protein A4U43_C07F34270 [Asparagus officinalis]
MEASWSEQSTVEDELELFELCWPRSGGTTSGLDVACELHGEAFCGGSGAVLGGEHRAQLGGGKGFKWIKLFSISILVGSESLNGSK